MNVNVDLYTPEDKEAFAVFLNASAAADRARPKEYDTLGGIASTVGWQRAAGSGEAQASDGESTSVVSVLSGDSTDNGTAKRERGKPAPGRGRRTKEEIAEDEEADRQDAARAAAGAESGAEVADRQISSAPEDRQDPDNPQDDADEAAETAAVKEASGKALTHDDVRNALGKYVKAYGMAAAQEDGPKVITMMFGEGKAKVSDVPDTQEDLAKAVAGIEEMLQKNPFNRAADF